MEITIPPACDSKDVKTRVKIDTKQANGNFLIASKTVVCEST